VNHRKQLNVGFLLSAVGAFFIVFLLSPSATDCFAADAVPVVTIDPGYGTTDDTFQLNVTVSGKMSNQIGRPQFESSDKFDLESIGTSTRSEFINGARSYQITYTFLVVPSGNLPPGEYALPKGSIEIDGQPTVIPPAALTILPSGSNNRSSPAPPGGSGQSNNAPNNSAANAAKSPTSLPGRSPTGIDFAQIVDNEEPYVGQQVVYRAEIAVSAPISGANLGDLEAPGFLRESFGKNPEQQRRVGDSVVYSIPEALFATKAGDVEIAPRALTANIRVPISRSGRTGRRGWDMIDEMFSDLDAFTEFDVVTKRLTAPAIKLRVKELPPPPKNVSGYVPVGDVKVTSRLDRKDVKQGESVTLTVEVTGDANLKPLELPPPADKSAQDFTMYVDQPSTDVSAGKDHVFFRKTFHIALIPNKSGKLFVPHYEIPTFNPKTGSYEFQHTSTSVLNVAEGNPNEKLVIKGADEAKQNSNAPKNAIERLGEDLLPLHVGPELLTKYEPLPPDILRLGLLIPPMLTALLAFFVSYRKQHGDPVKARRAGAARTARAAIGSASTADEGFQAFRTYLGARLRVPGESLTSADIKSRLGPTKMPEETINRIAELLHRYQGAIYGGSSTLKPEALQSLKDESLTLISEVERYGPK